MDDLDVAIIGAGAAGIAAARRLTDRGRQVRLIEAMPRPGGRAHTETIAGFPLDMGCGWLHSADRNPLVGVAEAEGVAIDRSEAAWQRQLRNIGAPAADQHAAWEAYEAWEARLRETPPANDCAGDAIAPADRWRPFINGLSSFINGTEIDRLSAKDFLAYEDHSTALNWRICTGYGAFITGLGDRLPSTFGTSAQAVDLEGAGVRIETDRGTIRARAAIVAVPTTILARGAIRFTGMVDDHLHAAAHLPLGLADKVYLAVADPEAIPAESHLLGDFLRTATGSYYLRPFGRPLIECFLGGANAKALEGSDAAAFVIDELAGLLGRDFAKGLKPVAVTRWAAEPTIGGSYSHALPGHHGARAILARPVNERLCFAGEACSLTDFSTAHGAWASGIAAADWIERGLT